MTGQAGPGARDTGSYIETANAVALGSGGAATMALRAACSGIEIQDHTPAAALIQSGRYAAV